MLELCLLLDLREHRFSYVLQEHNLQLELPAAFEQPRQTWSSAHSCRRPPETYQAPSLYRKCSVAPSASRISKPSAAECLLKALELALVLLNHYMLAPVGRVNKREGVVWGPG